MKCRKARTKPSVW